MSPVNEKSLLVDSEPEVKVLGHSEESEFTVETPGIFQKLFPRGELASSIFSFFASSMGAGTLGLPSAFASAGVGLAVIQLALVCAATVYSMRLLSIAFERTGYKTFEQLARNLYSPILEKAAAFFIIMFCWGVTVAYVLTVDDILGKLTAGVHWVPEAFKGTGGNRLLTCLFWAIFMLPLSLMLEISSLRYASALSTFSSLYLMTCMTIHACLDPKTSISNITWFKFDLGMITAIPTFVFAFCNQTNLFEIYTEMVPRTVRQCTKTSGIATTTTTVLYTIAGIAGYLNFGSGVDGDILDSFGGAFASPYITLAFVAICVTLTVSFPICIFPTRDAIVQLLGYESSYATPRAVRMLVCFVLASGSLALGLYVKQINIMFGILGGVCGSTIAFIFPALFFIKSGEFSIAAVGHGNFFGTIALLVAGVVGGGLGTAVSIWQTATSN